MRTARAVLVMAAVALSWCCSAGAGVRGGPASRLEAVRLGMTPGQVAEAVGPPRLVEPYGGPAGTEVWYYEDGVVILHDRKVTYRFPAAASQS